MSEPHDYPTSDERYNDGSDPWAYLRGMVQEMGGRGARELPVENGTVAGRLLIMEPIEGGQRIIQGRKYYIDVLFKMSNLRLVWTPIDEPWGYDRGYCFEMDRANPASTYTAVVAQAIVLNPDDADQEPVGWIKDASRHRVACALLRPPGPHRGYHPDCARCGSRP